MFRCNVHIFVLLMSSFALARRQGLALAKDRSAEMRKSYVTKLFDGSLADYFCCPLPPLRGRRRPFRTVSIYNARVLIDFAAILQTNAFSSCAPGC